jgi:Na+-translocating ferredoxin:NAD+ oxidoreductase subunit A
MSSLILIIISGVLVNNFVMSQFLGICPFLGISKKTETAAGMGMAVTFVMTLASIITYLMRAYLLLPFNLEYMQTIAFILVIAVLVQTVEMVLKKVSRALYQALGVYLPLITTNCAVLGVAINNTTAIDGGYNLIQSAVNGFAGALGFSLALVAFSAIREKLAMNDLPKWLDGFPGALIAAGLMAVAFQGFAGLI